MYGTRIIKETELSLFFKRSPGAERGVNGSNSVTSALNLPMETPAPPAQMEFAFIGSEKDGFDEKPSSPGEYERRTMAKTDALR